MCKFNWVRKANSAFLLCAVAALPAPAQTTAIATPAQITSAHIPAAAFTTLHSFCSLPNCTDGAVPTASLVQGADGNLYGTTPFGGASGPCDDNFGCGTMFRITPDGTLTTVYAFCSQGHCTDGAGANTLIQGTDGDLYGTSVGGGAYPNGKSLSPGTIFKITLNGELTTLYSFCPDYPSCTDGADPAAGLVQGARGTLYGTTFNGGDFYGGTCIYGCGTVFSVTSRGALESLDSFGVANGEWPQAGMIQGTDGKIYGTTPAGGSGICGIYCDGTFFSLGPDGTLTTLYNFCSVGGENCTDGALPYEGVVEGSDGNFYGATYEGGSGASCTLVIGCGTIFKITPKGQLTTIYSFCSQPNCADGEFPYGGLTLGTNGKFYGTTTSGGADERGTIFSLSSTKGLATLHSFDGRDGELLVATMVQSTDGSFYGTTEDGGANFDVHCGGLCGTVFKLSVDLAPFVKTLPTAGKTRATVHILGTNLTGATVVTFNGVAASFTVVSQTEITTSVPAGATTGTVQVVTSGGTLSGNVPFQVRP